MDASVVISGGALLLGLLTAIVGVVVKISGRLSALETKVDVFWRGVAIEKARILHSPHPEWARRDQLLERFMFGTLTMPEAVELAALCRDVLDHKDRAGAGEPIAASFLLRTLHREFGVELRTGVAHE